MKRTAAFALALLLALLVGRAQAQGWLVSLAAHATGPSRFLAIDKSAQSFFLFEQKSPLRAVYEIPCATGQALGDKTREGDLRTPEGVYFVTSKLQTGLDYELYGDLAFPLNFPNPVDVINGKTGHGIWIHGRGYPITPFETKGCVALNNPVIHNVASDIEMRMPVIIAGEVNWSDAPPAVQAEAEEVTAATRAWAEAWQNKSETFFDFHDAEKFSISQGEPFANFRSHKERLFKQLPWIVVAAEDIRAVPGPDYWVTYFVQFYRSPTLISQGVKRLYWQRDKAGKWKIVGMEFEQQEPTLAAKYPGGASRALTASLEAPEAETRRPDVVSEEDSGKKLEEPSLVNQDVATLIEAWRKAWEAGRIEEYAAFYAENAEQGDRQGRRSILEQKRTLWADRPPRAVRFKNVRMRPKKDNYVVEFVQEYESDGGYGDKGRKEVVLTQSGNAWRIVKETWRRL